MILVYKTNINNKSKAKKIKSKLDELLSNSTWNFDLEDCDNILRVVSEKNVSKILKEELKRLGIEIEPLPD